ncbi:hypothetical protein ACF0H5_022181 [Mactra antiquata]
MTNTRFVIFLVLLIHASNQLSLIRNYKECRVDDWHKVAAFSPVTLNKCMKECDIRIQCESLNYKRTYKLCELFGRLQYGQFETNTAHNGACVHILKSNITSTQPSTNCICPNEGICRPETEICYVKDYVGCYHDDSNRTLLDSNFVHDDLMTVEKCIIHCSDYTYAAPQYYMECFCGDTLQAQAADEDDCHTPCGGNPSQMCGGIWRGSVYKVH